MIRPIAWLIATVLVLATGGSAAIFASATRDALQRQWQARNDATATLLALALSQQRGDPDSMVQLLAAQADTGHYRTIRLRAPDGSVAFERAAPPTAAAAPGWLVELLPLQARPGVAAVGDGSSPLGTVEVQAHPAWAYEALWTSSLGVAGWLLLLALGALLAAAIALRAWRRALDDVVAQAHALQLGRFTAIAEPRTRELRRLAGAMNAMVERIRVLHEAQAVQLEALRRHAQSDPLTGLSNRAHFLAEIECALVGRHDAPTLADAPRRGALLIVRMRNLAAMNARIGRDAADRLLASVGALLLAYPQRVEGALAGRLNGSDLALYLPVNGMAGETSAALEASLRAALLVVDPAAAVAIGAVDGLATGGVSDAFARADEALAQAEADGHAGIQRCVVMAATAEAATGALGESRWRAGLADALATGRVQLVEHPVVDPAGNLIHLECPLRVQLAPGGPFESAQRWLPMATRNRLMQHVDLAAAELALGAIARDDRARSVHVAADSLAEPGFVQAIAHLLAGAPDAARRLAIEVSEAAVAHAERLGLAATAWRPLGVRLGLENAGRSLHLLLEAHARGVDYLKVDARFLRGVARDAQLAEYAGQVLAAARGMGLDVYAAGVDAAADLQRLWELGYAGASGPAVGPSR